MDELAFLPASAAVDLVRRKEISARELTEIEARLGLEADQDAVSALGDVRPLARALYKVLPDADRVDLGRRGGQRGVVVNAQVVVDGLGNVEDAQFVIRFLREVADDAGGVG